MFLLYYFIIACQLLKPEIPCIQERLKQGGVARVTVPPTLRVTANYRLCYCFALIFTFLSPCSGMQQAPLPVGGTQFKAYAQRQSICKVAKK